MDGTCGSPFPRWGYYLYYISSVFEIEPSLAFKMLVGGGTLPRKGHIAWLEERQLLMSMLRRGKSMWPHVSWEKGPQRKDKGFGGHAFSPFPSQNFTRSTPLGHQSLVFLGLGFSLFTCLRFQTSPSPSLFTSRPDVIKKLNSEFLFFWLIFSNHLLPGFYT